MTKKDPIDCPACRAGVPLVTDTSQLASASAAKLAITTVPGGAPECVCADCGHEQSMVPGFGAGGMGPCERCQSARVVLVTVVRDLFGENWRDAFKPDPAEDA